jgi:Tfp pilus assembly protein PilV
MQQVAAIQQNPQAMQDPNIQMQVRMMSEKIEARKAQLIADMMGRVYARREKNYFTI